MRDVIRSAGVALCAPVAAAALFAGSAAPAQAAYTGPDYPGTANCKVVTCTALVLGGAFPTNNLSYDEMGQILDGYVYDYKRVNIVHPGLTPSINVPAGILRLGNALDNTPGPKTVVGFSQGSLIADQMMRELAADPDNAPSASDLNFVIISDPTRGPLITKYGKYLSFLGYDRMPPAESQYDIVVVAMQYDGIADFPDKFWNFVSVSNAYAGAILLHLDSLNVDLSTVPDENITVSEPNSKGGRVTTYLVPTETLPLVRLMPFLAPYEAALKVQVDAGYSRNDTVNSVASFKTLAAETPAITPAPVEETAKAGKQDLEAAADKGATGNQVDVTTESDDVNAETPSEGGTEVTGETTELSGDAATTTPAAGEDADTTPGEDAGNAAVGAGSDTSDADAPKASHRLKHAPNSGSTVAAIKQRLADETANDTTAKESANNTSAAGAGADGSSSKADSTSSNDSDS